MNPKLEAAMVRMIAGLAVATCITTCAASYCHAQSLTKTQEGLLGGAVLGAGTGAIVGAAVHHPGSGALIGAGLGALGGGVIGHEFQQQGYQQSRLQHELSRQQRQLDYQRTEIRNLQQQAAD